MVVLALGNKSPPTPSLKKEGKTISKYIYYSPFTCPATAGIKRESPEREGDLEGLWVGLIKN